MQKGSALFLILIAVALFAALSYAISSSTRGSGSVSKEQTAIEAARLVQYASSIEQGTVRMRVLSGCTDNEISFENTADAAYTYVTRDDCKVFNDSGGGITYTQPSAQWLDSAQSAQALYGLWYFPANICIPFVGTGVGICSTDGLDNEEIILILPYIKKDICLTLNRNFGISSCSGDACADVAKLWPTPGSTRFTGTFTSDVAIYSAGTEYREKFEGCIQGSGFNAAYPAGSYHYFKVLVAR